MKLSAFDLTETIPLFFFFVCVLFVFQTLFLSFPFSSTLISDSMAELTAYSENLQTKLSEQTSSTQLAQDMQLLANKLQKDMLDAKDRTTSYLGELTTMVELNTDDVRDRVGTYATKLKKRLDKDTEQIRK